MSRGESDRFIDRIEAHFKQHKFGLFAVELRADHSLIGYIGLSVPSFVAAFTPCVEIGWRIAGDRWGQGLATEGALEVLGFAFGDLRLGIFGFLYGACQCEITPRDGENWNES